MPIKADDETLRMAQMGRAALLPGIQYALNFLQRELDRLREDLAEAQRGRGRDKTSYSETESLVATASLERKTQRGKRGSRSWVGMTPEERSLEMLRRVQMRARQKDKKKKSEMKSKMSNRQARLTALEAKAS